MASSIKALKRQLDQLGKAAEALVPVNNTLRMVLLPRVLVPPACSPEDRALAQEIASSLGGCRSTSTPAVGKLFLITSGVRAIGVKDGMVIDSDGNEHPSQDWLDAFAAENQLTL